MIFNEKLKNISLSLFFCFFIFLVLSLFLSFNKILIPLILSLIILFLNLRIKKIIFINLFLLIFILKIVFLFFNPQDHNKILSKTIYEKHFLYGVKNLKLKTSIYGGNMNPTNKKESKKIKITTDKLGFRNLIALDDSDFVLIGDSMLHNHRIDDQNLMNNFLNKNSSLKFYNASLSSTNVAHYLETIRYFKDNKYKNKFVVFVFSGNDFLEYKSLQKNYSSRLNNLILRNYFEVKKFFNFYTNIKFIIQIFKDDNLLNKVDRNQIINNEKVLFYKSYYIKPDQNMSFSEKFDFYYKYAPDFVIIIPTKAQVYCDYLDEYDCPRINYYKIFEDIYLFKGSKIFDSTQYLKDNAKYYLNKNKFIYEKDDTHLNELGITTLSNFLLTNVVK